MRERGTLVDDTVVATVMSNLGFHHAMSEAGIEVVTTAVGDRYVLEELRDKGLNLGGEQSGHIVLTDAATTGDGLLTALSVMARMAETGRSLAALAAAVQPLPQVMINVRADGAREALDGDAVRQALADTEQALRGRGRVVLRASGTEPLVRVTVEGADAAEGRQLAQSLADVVKSSAERS